MRQIQHSKFKIQKIGSMLIVLITFHVSLFTSVSAGEKWQGVDQTVVEQYAKEQGREAHKPLINTDQGDLLLFVFLIAGAAGGFAAGYYWRMLIHEKRLLLVNEKNVIGHCEPESKQSQH